MDLTDKTCRQFIARLSSKEPVPGGGSASALAGAAGAALGSMVSNLTLGKKKYADVQEDINRIRDKATSLQESLLSLVEKDAEAFAPLAEAYTLPKNNQEEMQAKALAMEEALRAASVAPIEIMENCCEAIDLHEELAEIGSSVALSDVGVGVLLCKAALIGASLNVSINCKSMADRSFAENLKGTAKRMMEKYSEKADACYLRVAEKLE
ncbi:MAG: cyclodeaminase/cyclohydrolase family protein [Clostridiales bacterium]|jgi:formiminotetrahydrofolate cyclodeaminase|nr:cyclodeaminase/cyclohydrolase family protein [Clostridiales bacterium]